MLQGKSSAGEALLTSEVWASVPCHKQGKKKAKVPTVPTLLFVLYHHSSGAMSHLIFSICFWPVWSGTAKQQKPVDSGLLTTTGWHTELQGD